MSDEKWIPYGVSVFYIQFLIAAYVCAIIACRKVVSFMDQKIQKELIALRRALHAIPETGDALPRTKQFVCDYLEDIGISYRCCDNCDGVIAQIRGAEDGKTVAFRADMDALNVQEETDVPFRSEIPGKMHGCGHDAHTAILLMTAKLLFNLRDRLCGNVRFIFQTGEETGSGAKKMIAAGGVEGVDALFALHVGNLAGDELSAGDIAIVPGYASAGKIKFTIQIQGKGTHSAFPEKGIDPILVAANILLRFQETMNVDNMAGVAAVLSVGSVHAGEDHNTIPHTATLKGSVRAQDPNVRAFLGQKVKQIAKETAARVGASCDLDIKRGSESVYNDPELAAFAAKAVASSLGEKGVLTALARPLMASDDFANYGACVPSVYFILHTNNPEKGIVEPNHSPRFDLDESVLAKGVAAYMAIAMDFLK